MAEATKTQFQAHRVNTLPEIKAPGAVYVVADAENQDYLELHVATKDGSKTRRVPTAKDIKAIADAAIEAKKVEPITEAKVVATFDDLEDLKDDTGLVFAYVQDASGDETVTAGGALYILAGGEFVKVTETESLDLKLTPESIPGLKDALDKVHEHPNKAVLDQLNKDENGNLTYEGQVVGTFWGSAEW